MAGWDKYQKFDIVDWLTDEECCKEYIKAYVEDNEPPERLASARRDVERARAFHGFGPKIDSRERENDHLRKPAAAAV